ncbi:type III PLP-dependent enzyme [Actibacterium sp. MT2.3-13A]|uniref:type III PLP-dependent enzyme n=1 Tax=Actibacterium sp. MT2.3-13A TaxID=2828332 RepID=UPI001BA64CB7|nr:type III PLP-dependent enzyme [Actibacterium sp. MT2.3-13A]
MELKQRIWADPGQYLRAEQPDAPVLFCAPSVLRETARGFIDGFGGLVTYAVKANPEAQVLESLAAAGIGTFDVASPSEMAQVRAVLPGAVLHYHNPVRSEAEVAAALDHGVASWSVDSLSELGKLAGRVPRGSEIAVRFKLPAPGGAYDFGTKFGAGEDAAPALLRAVTARGLRPALTFHPGTQCTEPRAWARHIEAAARIAGAAGVRLVRLNVGGGFPAHRGGAAPALGAIFEAIHAATRRAFGARGPALVCEPGRALVAEGLVLAARVKAIRDGADVFLNDGIYGALAELPLMGVPGRVAVIAPDGTPRRGAALPRAVFGPTCDSLDTLPGRPALPADMVEGDYLLFSGFGAYSAATATRFNGYGELRRVTVLSAGLDSGN